MEKIIDRIRLGNETLAEQPRLAARFMKKLPLRTAVCRNAIWLAALFFAVVAAAQNIYQLTPLSGFGSHGDGSVRPGDIPTLDAAYNQRGMAYDQVLTNLISVDTHTGQAGSD